jgi:hypothetical protein
MNATKTIYILAAISGLALAGCATDQPGKDSETVQVTYHVQKGKEAELEDLMMHAWDIYQNDHLVLSAHAISKTPEDGDKVCYLETFTWIKAPDNPPADVLAVWQQEQALCEARDGHKGIEILNVDTKAKE